MFLHYAAVVLANLDRSARDLRAEREGRISDRAAFAARARSPVGSAPARSWDARPRIRAYGDAGSDGSVATLTRPFSTFTK
jgi:hypothetical protein